MRPLRRRATTQMTRTTASKAAGIDLLDRLYCNQILVHLIFGLEERDWLQRLAMQVRAAVREKGATGLRAERLLHLTLCLLEIFLADEFEDLAKRVPFDPPPLPPDLTPAIVAKIRAHNRNYFAAALLAADNRMGAPEDEYVALEVASGLKDEFRSAPASVRHRLVERVLAIEFPNAPIDVFTWLAKMGVVPSKKFRDGIAAPPLHEAVVVRAASICEFEMFRQLIAGQMHFGDRCDGGFSKALRTQLKGHISDEARERLLTVMQAEERRINSPTLQNSFAWLIESRWKDKDYVALFLSNCHSMAPYIRAALHKQSTALSDIAAAMIAIRKTTQDPDKALYAEEREDTIAHDVSTELSNRGFNVHARTIYRHFRESLQIHATHRNSYFKLLNRLDVALPAEYGDIFHYYQVSLTS